MLMVTMNMKNQSNQVILIQYRCYADGNYH